MVNYKFILCNINLYYVKQQDYNYIIIKLNYCRQHLYVTHTFYIYFCKILCDCLFHFRYSVTLRKLQLIIRYSLKSELCTTFDVTRTRLATRREMIGGLSRLQILLRHLTHQRKKSCLRRGLCIISRTFHKFIFMIPCQVVSDLFYIQSTGLSSYICEYLQNAVALQFKRNYQKFYNFYMRIRTWIYVSL